MDAAIDRTVADLTTAGPASFLANRRAFRIAHEPLDAFRRYCALYAREQAACILGPAMIANLERNWPTKAVPNAQDPG